MNDFNPETRRSGWYATDSRRAVSGYLVDVLLEKRGDLLALWGSLSDSKHMGEIERSVRETRKRAVIRIR